MSNHIRKNYEELANFLRIISHPVRLAILDILFAKQEECVCHLDAILGFRQAYLSQHLMCLREAGIVIDRRKGRHIFYRITDNNLIKLLEVAKELSGQGANQMFFESVEPSCPEWEQNSKQKRIKN